MSRPTHLDILLRGELIGTLMRLGSDRTIFVFAEEYVQHPGRPTLSLAFKDSTGALISNLPAKNLRLHPFFSNLLPEGHLRRYLARRARVDPQREFLVLAALGRDLPGAVQAVAPDVEELDPAADDPVSEEHAFQFSLAGVELKFSALHESTGGLTIPASGAGGSWIVKLPSQRFPNVPENEYAMMSLAQRIGIEVPPIELVPVASIGNLPAFDFMGERHALALERFDRSASGEKIHMEDFAQVFGVYPEQKYGEASYRNIASVIAAEAPDDIPEFIRRLTFCALIGNGDMHLKNWSLVYRDPVSPMLAPAYDLISTVAYLNDGTAALKVSRSRRFDRFDEDELKHFAAKAGLPERATIDTALETVDRFRVEWERAKRELPISPALADAVECHARTVPLFRRLGGARG